MPIDLQKAIEELTKIAMSAQRLALKDEFYAYDHSKALADEFRNVLFPLFAAQEERLRRLERLAKAVDAYSGCNAQSTIAAIMHDARKTKDKQKVHKLMERSRAARKEMDAALSALSDETQPTGKEQDRR